MISRYFDRSAQAGPSKLGTFAGVFTPSIMTIVGLILFLRLGYVVGNSGLVRAMGMILLANTISILTSFSLAAIATNLKVKSGGDYYLISRTLGLGYGGAIGVVLFLAQSVSIGFYCMGFGEAAAALFTDPHPQLAQGFALLAVGLLFALAWMGADWATRFQYAIMACMAAALLSFALGAWSMFDQATLMRSMPMPENGLPFWAAFALFFPAVTGFTQGVSMSGDLRDPARSLPLGTFSAVGVSILVYVGATLLLAGSQPMDVLATDYGVMKRDAFAAWLIDLGIFAATLSSALASFMGAPRILQSLARDRVFPVLRPFAAGVGENDNPRRGVILAGIVAMGVIGLGNLNLIAMVVSMFFLVSYGLLNYATYFEARAASPSFRPRFRWYRPELSFAGMVACGAVMFAIDVVSALAALTVLVGLFQYLKLRGVSSRWADSGRSHDLQRVRTHLLSAAAQSEHPRDWRPYILAFSDSPKRRGQLLYLASWLEGGSGITTVVRVLEGTGQRMLAAREEAQKGLADEIRALDLNIFPLVVVAPSVDLAVPMLVQSVGIGPIGVNTVISNWIEAPNGVVGHWEQARFGQNQRTAFRLGCNLLMLDAEGSEWAALSEKPAADRVIDVWWSENQTGQLMLLLAYLLTRSPEWRSATIRVLVPAAPGADESEHASLQELLASVRIAADMVVVENPSVESLSEHSGTSSIVFLPFSLEADGFKGPFGNPLNDILPRLPVVVLTMAAKDVKLAADPDEGTARDRSAARDRYEDASARLAKAREGLARSEARLARLRQEEPEPEADPAKRAAHVEALEKAIASSLEAARNLDVAIVEHEAAARTVIDPDFG